MIDTSKLLPIHINDLMYLAHTFEFQVLMDYSRGVADSGSKTYCSFEFKYTDSKGREYLVRGKADDIDIVYEEGVIDPGMEKVTIVNPKTIWEHFNSQGESSWLT